TILEHYYCRETSGRIVFEQAMPRGSRGIRRRDLTAALIKALGEEENLIYAELNELEFDSESRVAAARFKSAAGTIHVKADVYIGAEGVNSRARQAMYPDWPTIPDRVPELVGLVRCDRAVAWAGSALNKFHAPEGGIALGILPVDAEHVVWYLQFDSCRHPMSTAVLRGDAAARRSFTESLVGGWAHPIPSLLATTDFGRVHLWRPVESDLVPRFHRGNLALVGDAAHPFSPFTSQGVSSAIADAAVLATELEGWKSGDDLEEALERYSRQRRRECAPYLNKGRQLRENFLAPLSESSALLPIALKVERRIESSPSP
ncbi:MAG TPA: NAD(P)/FAD-dependent oxidoreductase, partial [Alphaproteobacteria bacterium]|nr:NAD(P)/FAD-dependent oxidoreductase [Alphaproteobacteria bacterium]